MCLVTQARSWLIEQAILFETVVDEREGSLDIASISLHAIVGTLSPRTMTVLGLVNRRQVVILINSSSTHDFLDLAMVKKCKLAVQRGKPINVHMANGESLN